MSSANLPVAAPDRCDARVLFVAAAGPRRGYGHLVRCVSFARALGVRPLLAVRGSRRVVDTAAMSRTRCIEAGTRLGVLAEGLGGPSASTRVH